MEREEVSVVPPLNPDKMLALESDFRARKLAADNTVLDTCLTSLIPLEALA